MVVAILGQDSPSIVTRFSIEICLILRINMVCLSCSSGTQWFNWEPFICSLIGISSMIGLVGGGMKEEEDQEHRFEGLQMKDSHFHVHVQMRRSSQQAGPHF